MHGEWRVICLDPMSLLPHNHPQPQEGETLPMHAIRRATSILRFMPDRVECELILERWRQERRWICQSSEANLFTASACVRGLLRHSSCADDIFEPVRLIVAALDTADKRQTFNQLCYAIFYQGMFQRRWAGEKTPFPILEDFVVVFFVLDGERELVPLEV